MDVTVKNTCSRCSKVEEISVSLEEANQIAESSEMNDNTIEAITADVTKLMENDLAPEVLVAHKIDGEVHVRTFKNVCHPTETGKRKGSCATRLLNLISEMFMENTKKKAKKKSMPQDHEGTYGEPTTGEASNG
jgi:hypothetical protein